MIGIIINDLVGSFTKQCVTVVMAFSPLVFEATKQSFWRKREPVLVRCATKFSKVQFCMTLSAESGFLDMQLIRIHKYDPCFFYQRVIFRALFHRLLLDSEFVYLVCITTTSNIIIGEIPWSWKSHRDIFIEKTERVIDEKCWFVSRITRFRELKMFKLYKVIGNLRQNLRWEQRLFVVNRTD